MEKLPARRVTPLFRETLRGLPPWLAGGFVIAGVAGAAALLWSSRPYHGEAAFWLAALPGLAAAVVAPVVLAMWSLETEVRPGTLAVRLRPFAGREIALDDVESCEPRTYRPIREYLGWGWRIGPGGEALTVPGTQGVQLVMRGGKRLLISSRQPQRLAEAIRSAGQGIRR